MRRVFIALILAAVMAGAGLLAGSGALASLAPAGSRVVREPVSPVIFPEQRIPLRFSHIQHLTLPGSGAGNNQPLACDVCHERAPGSRSSIDNLIPGEDVCAKCHAIERSQPTKAVAAGQPPARCDACHPGYRPGDRFVARVEIPTPNIKFNHQVHNDRGIDCQACHGDFLAERVGLATRAQLPSMSLCLQCHDSQGGHDGQGGPGGQDTKNASARCTTCHLAGPGGLVRTDYPTGKLAPRGVIYGDAHDLSFRTDHAAVAQNNADYCASCHQERFCLDCHSGVTKPLDFHGSDYIALHAMDARRNTPQCTTCHRQQTFCTGCHSRSGVSPDGRGSEYTSSDPMRRFHPPGWADVGGRGPNHHSFQAQRSIRQCAACHREESCLRCHSAQPGSTSINPHPPGWASSSRCQALAAKNGRMCLRCHIDMIEIRCQ